MVKILRDEIGTTGFRSVIIYGTVWFLVLLFPLTNELVDTGNYLQFNWTKILNWWAGASLYLVIFLIHNFILIKKLFLQKKNLAYTIAILLIIILFGVYEYFKFKHFEATRIQDAILMNLPPPPPPPNPSFIPRPVTTKIILLLLMLASNLLIVVQEKFYREQRRLKEIESLRLQDELKYLKTQVNPHFFMNMLNNIHAMVEMNASKAQDMILELSKLMRYVLYDGNNSSVTLESEIKFIQSYITLMRQRFPEDKVKINLMLPENPDKDVMIPPLLLITFLENTFKHGISYRNKTIIKIQLDHKPRKIILHCYNTKPDHSPETSGTGGMGLSNVKRRLDLLYGNEYTLEYNETPHEYNVELIIPCQK